MEIISQDYETYVENCKASSNIILSECEYQAANVSHRGYLDKEVAVFCGNLYRQLVLN